MYNIEQERWNDVLNNHWWGLGHYAIIETLIKAQLRISSARRNNLRCLDVGCSGGTTLGFLKQFGQAYGFDISSDGLSYCADRSGVIQADATKIPFKNESFDLITVLDVAEHVADDGMLFREIYRIAKKGGTVFVNVPAFAFLWRSHDVRYGHKRRYSKSSITRLALKHCFTIEKAIYLHAHFMAPLLFSALTDRLSGKCPGARDDFISFGPLFDTLLLNTLLLERRLSRYVALPLGISLFLTLKKL